MRRILAGGVIAVLMLVLATVTGCSPEVRGVLGLRLAPDGGLVAAVAWCSDVDPGDLTVYQGVDGNLGKTALQLDRDAPVQAGRYWEITLASPPTGWRAGPALVLDASAVYELRAWNRSGSARAGSFPFRLGEVPAADAGNVLTKNYNGKGYEAALFTTSDLRASADKIC